MQAQLHPDVFRLLQEEEERLEEEARLKRVRLCAGVYPRPQALVLLNACAAWKARCFACVVGGCTGAPLRAV